MPIANLNLLKLTSKHAIFALSIFKGIYSATLDIQNINPGKN